MTYVFLPLRKLLCAAGFRFSGARLGSHGVRALHALLVTWVATWCLGSSVVAAAVMSGAVPSGAIAATVIPPVEVVPEPLAPEQPSQPAAGASDAPMCDPNGASVAARPEMDLPLLDRGRFEELPCDALMLLRRGELLPDARHLAVESDPDRPQSPPRDIERTQGEGACRLMHPDNPRRQEPVLIGSPANVGLVASPGHGRDVYRPPLAR